MANETPEEVPPVELVFRVQVARSRQDAFFTQMSALRESGDVVQRLRECGVQSVRLLQPLMVGGESTEWELRVTSRSMGHLARFIEDVQPAPGGGPSTILDLVMAPLEMHGVEVVPEPVPPVFRSWSVVVTTPQAEGQETAHPTSAG